MARCIQDPAFGELEMFERTFWRGRVRPTFSRDAINVLVEPPDHDTMRPPTDLQRDAYAQIAKAPPALLEAAVDAVVTHWDSVADAYRDGDPDVPLPTTRTEVIAAMGDVSLYVPEQLPESGRVVMLDWNCTWDREQGVRAMFRNEQFVEILGQGDGWE